MAHGPGWAEWNKTIAPVVAARRRTLQLLGSKQAVQILFSDIAPRFSDRPGGYTRVLRLAKPRLGDAGVRAILEFVGTHDRKRRKAAKPAFESESPPRSSPRLPRRPATETHGRRVTAADANTCHGVRWRRRVNGRYC